MGNFAIQILGRQIVLQCLVYFFAASAQAQTFKQSSTDQFFLDESLIYFVEVEPFEIRVEVLVKGPLLVELLNYPLGENKTISVNAQADFKQYALEHFENYFTLSLGGVPSVHDKSQASFLEVGDANSVIKEKVIEEPIDEAVIGLSFSFSLAHMPDFFQLNLTELPKNISRVPVRVQALSRTQHMEFNEFSLTFDWSRQGLEFRLPKIKPVKVARTSWLGKPKLNINEAAVVLEQLLDNIYNAFEYQQESTIYDQLAVSVAGEQLASLYLEQKQRMEAVNRGGAKVKILNIVINEVKILSKSDDAFIVTGQWEVAGKVTHFGHTHERLNWYQAKFVLFSTEGRWLISDIDVLDESRIQ